MKKKKLIPFKLTSLKVESLNSQFDIDIQSISNRVKLHNQQNSPYFLIEKLELKTLVKKRVVQLLEKNRRIAIVKRSRYVEGFSFPRLQILTNL